MGRGGCLDGDAGDLEGGDRTMSDLSRSGPDDDPSRLALEKAKRALRLAVANLPHLSGLAHTLRLTVSRSVPVAAIGPTGLLLVNPTVFSKTSLPDLAFV